MSKPSTDDQLRTRWSMLDRLQGSRSDESWRWFIGRYREFVYGVLRGILRDEDDAQRARDEFWGYLFTTEVFSKADPNRRFRAFLSGTVRNFARNWRGRSRPRLLALGIDDDPPIRELPEDEEFRLWSRTVLALCMRTLRERYPEQADVLCWFYGLGGDQDEGEPQPLPTSEIASRLHVTPGTVHQHLSRGRRRLKRLLEEEIESTVHSPDEIDDELRRLMSALLATSPGLVDH